MYKCVHVNVGIIRGCYISRGHWAELLRNDSILSSCPQHLQSLMFIQDLPKVWKSLN